MKQGADKWDFRVSAMIFGCAGPLLLLLLFLTSDTDAGMAVFAGNTLPVVHKEKNGTIAVQSRKGHLTTDDYIRDVVTHPAFHGFGELLLPWEDNTRYEDLAAAIGYVFRNAHALRVSTQNYSLWGGSAGARMVGNIALNNVAGYGQEKLPQPATVVIAYTGQSSYSAQFPPTFLTVSADDGIANVTTVDKRVQNLKSVGVEVEYRRYQSAGHGFGAGTDAVG